MPHVLKGRRLNNAIEAYKTTRLMIKHVEIDTFFKQLHSSRDVENFQIC